jgi:quercetin dioxygenase-like cupin family protein
MTNPKTASPKTAPYVIEDQLLIAETPELRVQILTLAKGQEVPWHHHSAVTDSFICLDGPMLVRTRSNDGDHALSPGDRCAVPPMVAHQVAGKDGGRCRFVIVQGIGAYDFVAAPS